MLSLLFLNVIKLLFIKSQSLNDVFVWLSGPEWTHATLGIACPENDLHPLGINRRSHFFIIR